MGTFECPINTDLIGSGVSPSPWLGKDCRCGDTTKLKDGVEDENDRFCCDNGVFQPYQEWCSLEGTSTTTCASDKGECKDTCLSIDNLYAAEDYMTVNECSTGSCCVKVNEEICYSRVGGCNYNYLEFGTILELFRNDYGNLRLYPHLSETECKRHTCPAGEGCCIIDKTTCEFEPMTYEECQQKIVSVSSGTSHRVNNYVTSDPLCVNAESALSCKKNRKCCKTVYNGDFCVISDNNNAKLVSEPSDCIDIESDSNYEFDRFAVGSDCSVNNCNIYITETDDRNNNFCRGIVSGLPLDPDLNARDKFPEQCSVCGSQRNLLKRDDVYVCQGNNVWIKTKDCQMGCWDNGDCNAECFDDSNFCRGASSNTLGIDVESYPFRAFSSNDGSKAYPETCVLCGEYPYTDNTYTCLGNGLWENLDCGREDTSGTSCIEPIPCRAECT